MIIGSTLAIIALKTLYEQLGPEIRRWKETREEIHPVSPANQEATQQDEQLDDMLKPYLNEDGTVKDEVYLKMIDKATRKIAYDYGTARGWTVQKKKLYAVFIYVTNQIVE